MTFQTILILVIIGLLAGILSGFVGVGGGIILVPALVLFGMSQYDAQGTSLALLLAPVGVFAVMNYYKAGHVKVNTALILSLGFVVGAYFGSKLSLKIPEDIVKKVFAAFMIVVAVKLLISK